MKLKKAIQIVTKILERHKRENLGYGYDLHVMGERSDYVKKVMRQRAEIDDAMRTLTESAERDEPKQSSMLDDWNGEGVA